jgi:hypothetical protein
LKTKIGNRNHEKKKKERNIHYKEKYKLIIIIPYATIFNCALNLGIMLTNKFESKFKTEIQIESKKE